MALRELQRVKCSHEVDKILRRVLHEVKESGNPLNSWEVRIALQSLQNGPVSDVVREGVEEQLLGVLKMPRVPHELGLFSYCALKSRLSPAVMDQISCRLNEQFKKLTPRTIGSAVSAIAGLQVATPETAKLVQGVARTLGNLNFRPMEMSLVVHALCQIPSAPLESVWPSVARSLERQEWSGHDLCLLCHGMALNQVDDVVAQHIARLLPSRELRPIDVAHALQLYSRMADQDAYSDISAFLLNELRNRKGSKEVQKQLPIEGFTSLCLSLSRMGKLQEFVEVSRVTAKLEAMDPSHLCNLGAAARHSCYDEMLDILATRVDDIKEKFEEPRHFANAMNAFQGYTDTVDSLATYLLEQQNMGLLQWECFKAEEFVMIANGSKACEIDLWWDSTYAHVCAQQHHWTTSSIIQLANAFSMSRHAKNVVDVALAHVEVSAMRLVDASMLLTCMWKVEVLAPIAELIWKRVENVLPEVEEVDVICFNSLIISAGKHDFPQATLLPAASKVAWGRLFHGSSVPSSAGTSRAPLSQQRDDELGPMLDTVEASESREASHLLLESNFTSISRSSTLAQCVSVLSLADDQLFTALAPGLGSAYAELSADARTFVGEELRNIATENEKGGPHHRELRERVAMICSFLRPPPRVSGDVISK